MQEDILRAGVNPGSPATQTEIKALICTILSNTGETMSFMQLYETFTEHALVNYFDLVSALEQLCASGHLTFTEQASSGSQLYQVTQLGLLTGQELMSSVPPSVREKAMDSAGKVLRRKQRESEVKVTTVPVPDGGFMMEFSIPDSGCDLVRFSLFAPTQEDCEHMKRRFLNAPLFIYNGVLALLTGNRQILGQVFPEEDLF